jgi:hypothetical protein
MSRSAFEHDSQVMFEHDLRPATIRVVGPAAPAWARQAEGA